jgi:hypothetical protein
MSTEVKQIIETETVKAHMVHRPPRRLRRRWVLTAVAAIAVPAIVTGVVVSRTDGSTDSGGAAPSASPAAVAAVERRTVAAQQQVDGVLGFAGDYQVVGQLAGTLTDLPRVGDTRVQGNVLFRVDGKPVILLNGKTPAWRDLTEGVTGLDAEQLNAALVALGYADGLDLDPKSDRVTWRTQKAVKNLQSALGMNKTGTLTRGEVVFLPGPLRVTEVQAALGSPAGPGQNVMKATSTRPQVTADIPVTLAQTIKKGDPVSVTLPNLSTAKGTVTAVGTVATKPERGTATVSVLITLADPKVAAGLDQAPVLVAITTATAKNALVVPVTALLALAGGGYAVEVADSRETRLVPVKLGLFDSGGGVVEVTGASLEAGQRVVVPST